MEHPLTITAMDKDGNVTESHTTKKPWSISELQCHYDRLKIELYNGDISHILIGREK